MYISYFYLRRVEKFSINLQLKIMKPKYYRKKINWQQNSMINRTNEIKGNRRIRY